MRKVSILKTTIIFCLLFILIACSILLYSHYIGTKGLNINEHKISYKTLSSDFYGLKVVHISDIHYGRTIHEKELNNLVNKINLVKPDIVVFTGDLVDKDIKLSSKDEQKIINILSKIDANIGKYAIKGEDDYKFKNWKIIIENAGFMDLNDTYDLIYTNTNDYILLAGMSTNIHGKVEPQDKLKNMNDFLNSTEVKPNYSILLMHEPDFIDNVDYKFNLVLAGHSHNGQVRLPIIGPIIKYNYAKNYYDEYYKLDNTKLYISNGLGTTDVDFRLFNKPSFNLYRLTN